MANLPIFPSISWPSAVSHRDPIVELETEDAVSERRQMGAFVLGMAGLTWLLMGLGSATRVMNAGLSCPDWPLCYGTLWPSMNLQIFLEWFHRLVAATVGGMTLIWLGWTIRRHRRLPGWVRWSSGLALVLVVGQGLLGGLTVTELLRFEIVTAHLGTGLLFFATVLVTGTALVSDAGSRVSPWMSWIAVTSALLVYGQSLLGGLVASRWAVHQCLSGVVQSLCTVLHSHLVGVVPATLAVLLLVGWGVRQWHGLSPLARRLLLAIALLLVSQLALGLGTFYLRLQVEPLTVGHQMIGAALWGSLLVLALDTRSRPQTN